MVMGPTHAMSGAAAGLILPSILPGMTATPAVSLSFAGVCAGAALLPDIDSPGSTVSRSLGALTWGLSKVVNKVSWAFYSATSGPKDNHRDGGHRTLTHTGAFAVVVSIGVTALTGWGGRYAVLAVLFFMASLAIRGLLNDWAKNNGWIGIALAAAASHLRRLTDPARRRPGMAGVGRWYRHRAARRGGCDHEERVRVPRTIGDNPREAVVGVRAARPVADHRRRLGRKGAATAGADRGDGGAGHSAFPRRPTGHHRGVGRSHRAVRLTLAGEQSNGGSYTRSVGGRLQCYPCARQPTQMRAYRRRGTLIREAANVGDTYAPCGRHAVRS